MRRILDAVAQGREELILDAVRWLHYDRQLYLLKRIARTEMATAMHRAIIESTKDDDDVIGYQWRLSSSHPRPDICDYYANVEFGLGRGVWPKEQVPPGKAHPQCMCKLIPRVTRVREKGSAGFREFLDSIPSAQRRSITPRWAQDLVSAGVPLDALLRPDGMGFRKMAEMRDLMGDERFEAAKRVGKAMNERVWLDRDYHVKKRLDEGNIRSPREIDRRFENVLAQRDTEFYAIVNSEGGIGRLYGLNHRLNEISVIDRNGRRVTWFPFDLRTPDDFLQDMHKRVTRQTFRRIGRKEELWQTIWRQR